MTPPAFEESGNISRATGLPERAAKVAGPISFSADPVITTRTGGIPEATGDHCLYHAAGDIADLTARLNQVASMSDAVRAGLSRRARDYCLRFDRATILANLLAPSGQLTAA